MLSRRLPRSQRVEQEIETRLGLLSLRINVCVHIMQFCNVDLWYTFTGRSIKIHLYWAMKNCGGCPETLRKLILNIPNHYMVLSFQHHTIQSCSYALSCRESTPTAIPVHRVITPHIFPVERSSRTPRHVRH